MKLFMQKSKISKFASVKEFAEEYQIGPRDFILASKHTYETYFAGMNLPAVVAFKSTYGAGEPTDIMLDALLADFRKTDCDRIIAIGGGSVIDMAKILVLAGNGSASEIFNKKVPLEKCRELIAVPTTCGAGSEVSNVSIIGLTEIQSKLGLAVDEIYADEAVLIPELLADLPYSFFVTSAIDAFIHAIESYVSPKANLYTEMFSMKAMEMILNGFKEINARGADARFDYLDEFLTASNLAGIAFGNAGTGAVHAMSYPLSGVYHVTHGEANYQFLTAVFAKYQELDPTGKILGLNRFLGNLLECGPDDVYGVLESLLDRLITRKPLREYGMKEEEIESFAGSVEESQQRLLNQSYVKLNAGQMAEIYRKLF